ncbi:MAG: hypothetical protein U5K84_00260 [Alkalibacterium sp.]|nr:hypothetical protein [Alkalibacterium sp.]
MDTVKVEKFYNVLLESTQLIRSELDSTFIEAFIETGENILDNGEVHIENNLPEAQTRDTLKALYDSISLSSLTLEEKKKAVQMMLISSVKEDKIQVNHQPTPDGMRVILSYFIDLFFERNEPLHLADLSVGSGTFCIHFSLHCFLTILQSG